MGLGSGPARRYRRCVRPSVRPSVRRALRGRRVSDGRRGGADLNGRTLKLRTELDVHWHIHSSGLTDFECLNGMQWEPGGDFELFDVGRLLAEEDLDGYDQREGGESYCDPKRNENGSLIMRKRRRSQLPYIPPVVKHDIRRHYCRMLTNVNNADDVSLLKSFLETYGNLSNIRYTMEVEFGRRRPGAGYDPALYYLEGLPEILCFTAVRGSFISDSTSTITKTAVKTRSDTDRSEIHFSCVATMSLTYAVDLFALYEDIFDSADEAACLGDGEGALSSSSASSLSASEGEDNDVMRVFRRHSPVSALQHPDPFEFYRSRRGAVVPLKEDPLEISLAFDNVIYLNERRQIERLHSSKPRLVTARPLAQLRR